MFLLCPTAGDSGKNQKETVSANLKTFKADEICTNINQFEKALVQVQDQIKSEPESVQKTCEIQEGIRGF